MRGCSCVPFPWKARAAESIKSKRRGTRRDLFDVFLQATAAQQQEAPKWSLGARSQDFNFGFTRDLKKYKDDTCISGSR